MKEFLKSHVYLLLTIASFHAMIITGAFSVSSFDSQTSRFTEENTLHGDTEFKNSCYGRVDEYLVDGVSITGEPVEDRLGL